MPAKRAPISILSSLQVTVAVSGFGTATSIVTVPALSVEVSSTFQFPDDELVKNVVLPLVAPASSGGTRKPEAAPLMMLNSADQQLPPSVPPPGTKLPRRLIVEV